MLSLPPSVRIFIARGATDMRKSFDTLAALVCNVIDEDPQSGHLFVFVNRRKDRAKILWWDRSGYCLLAKRLEQMSYSSPPELTAPFRSGARGVGGGEAAGTGGVLRREEGPLQAVEHGGLLG